MYNTTFATAATSLTATPQEMPRQKKKNLTLHP